MHFRLGRECTNGDCFHLHKIYALGEKEENKKIVSYDLKQSLRRRLKIEKPKKEKLKMDM